MNNEIKIAEACGLVQVIKSEDNEQEYFGDKKAWTKATKYWDMLEAGEYEQIEQDLDLELAPKQPLGEALDQKTIEDTTDYSTCPLCGYKAQDREDRKWIMEVGMCATCDKQALENYQE